uniref:Uncharacterized protein n=1 Tax=Noccaea caerulescens TaxID=107243 RepID=A0A1J3JWA3_NOCCA
MIRQLDQEKLLLLKLLFFSEMLAILTSPSSNAASCQWDESGFRCRPLQTWNNSTTHQKQLASSHQPRNPLSWWISEFLCFAFLLSALVLKTATTSDLFSYVGRSFKFITQSSRVRNVL